jgi:hypothetical protein
VDRVPQVGRPAGEPIRSAGACRRAGAVRGRVRAGGRVQRSGAGGRARSADGRARSAGACGRADAVPGCAPVPLLPFAWNIRLPRKLWATGVAQMFRNGRMFRGKFRIAEKEGHPPSRPGGPWGQRDARDTRTAAGTGRARPGLVRARPSPARRYRNTPSDQCPATATAATGHRVPLTGTPRTRATARITRTSLVPDPHHSVSVAHWQEGVISRRQLLEAGLSSQLIKSRLERGRWQGR